MKRSILHRLNDCKGVGSCARTGLRYSLLPPKMRVSAEANVRTELVQAGADAEGSELSRKWLKDPGTKVDVGSSYHCVAKGTTCRIVHPLNFVN